MRSGTVVTMKDAEVTVQDDATRAHWKLPYAAIEIPAGSRATPQVSASEAHMRLTRNDFRVGDRVSFEDRHLQLRVGTIVRINQKTAGVDCDDERGWRVPFGLLRPLVDL